MRKIPREELVQLVYRAELLFRDPRRLAKIAGCQGALLHTRLSFLPHSGLRGTEEGVDLFLG